MKKRITIISVVVVLALSGALLAFYRNSAKVKTVIAKTKPSSLRLAGLRANVEVRRDERGIPYIEAANEQDLYFAQGYVVASERLWQMDFLRRTACGELAEVLGPSALNQDKEHRAYGFAPLAEQMVERLAPPVRAATEAYTRGVNAYIESLDESDLPKEYRGLQLKPRSWRVADSLILGKLFAESLSTSWQTDIMRAALTELPSKRQEELLPITSPLDVIMVGSDKGPKKAAASQASASIAPSRATAQLLAAVSESMNLQRRALERVGLYAEDLAASNNWVVSSQHSSTGKPLLANDPHLEASAPSIWYMLEMSAPGLRVAGVTIPGAPGVIIGHNEHIAWGITNVGADVQDVYIEKFDKDNPQRYMTAQGWRDVQVRHEKITVRKSVADPATETVDLDVTVTRHGPIILDQDGKRYALAWPTLDPTANEFGAYYSVNRARNWQDFRAALNDYTGFPLNFVYADVDGHIGYWAAGRYPIRKAGAGILPYDGSTDQGEWVGYIPFKDTPNLYDPPSGIIVTANNRIVGNDYPYYLTQSWVPPYRARRIYNLLTAKSKLSVEDFRAIQADTYSFPDAIFIGEVVKLARPLAGSSPEWQEILSQFDGWNFMMDADSRQMPLSLMMRGAFQRRIVTGGLGEKLTEVYGWTNAKPFFDYIITTRPPEWLPKEFDSYEALLLACYKEGLENLTKRLGPNREKWQWGNMAQVRFQHPLANAAAFGEPFAIPPFPQRGGGQAINKGPSVSMRFIADLSNWDNTRLGITLGESGDPASPHWKDQLADWQAATPRVFPFNKNTVASAAGETLTLLAAQ